jgi:hypothetical protein
MAHQVVGLEPQNPLYAEHTELSRSFFANSAIAAVKRLSPGGVQPAQVLPSNLRAHPLHR